MKRKRAALYNPYLDTMGGGERHILSILKVLNDSGYDIDIFWHQDLHKEIATRLNLHFDTPPRFLNTWITAGTLQRFQMLGGYDIFFYVTDGSYFFSSAKKNFVFSMVPQKALYEMNSLNRLKTWNYRFISNSKYTQKRLQGWEIFSDVIYPYIDEAFINTDGNKVKKPIILTVGRFFQHLHSKRQDIAIEWFKVLKKEYPEFKDYTLILAGSVKSEDQEYMDMLMGLAEGREDILFKTNIAFTEMKQLYEDAAFYWHLAGWEVDDKAHPEAVEHLGITPLEAMASGCITCAVKVGGPTEIIKHNKTGILFHSQQELFDTMKKILKDENTQKNVRFEANEFVKKHFSYDVFKKRVQEVLLI